MLASSFTTFPRFSWRRSLAKKMNFSHETLSGTSPFLVDFHDGGHMTTWQECYAAAVLETDPHKFKEKLEAAEAAIFVRIQELAHDSNHSDERSRIAEAIKGIRRLQVERLHFPPLPQEASEDLNDSNG
jgi:hypothetical protein